MTWLVQNWKLVGSVLLTILMACNAAFGFLSAETVALILTSAGGLGVTVLHSAQLALHRNIDEAHAKLDLLAEPVLGGSGPDNGPITPPHIFPDRGA